MSKRKINQQQQRRIENKQSKLLATPELNALVIANHGKNLEVENTSAEIIQCTKRQHLGAIVPGDRVLWQMDPATQSGVVVAIEPRRNLLSRPDSRGELHAVAANIDQMFIIIAPTPAPQPTTVDRYLIAAELQDIQPIVVLNKEDLLPNDPQQKELLMLTTEYARLGIDTIIISAKQQKNIATLQDKLIGKTSVFVGQSGVGKSSIISILLPDHEVKTGDLSVLNQQGKHTTTTTRLYHLPNNAGNIVDSPGIREFPLWPMEAAELARGFIELRPLLGECKFRNCIHVKEPGCALINAADNGKIATFRLQSYQKILADMPPKNHFK